MAPGSGRIAAAALLWLAGCGPAREEPEEVRLEIYSWWTAPGEREALEELDRLNHAQHPNVRLAPIAAEHAEEAFAQLDTHLAYRMPPDTYQANAGANLLARVLLDRDQQPGKLESRRLEPLDNLFAEAAEAPWDEVTAAVSAGGLPFGAPVDLHRINNLYFNVAKLGSRAMPTDLEGLLALLEELSAQRGGPAFGIGTRDYWTVEMLAFENLLPSITTATPDFYARFWRGELPPTEAETREILDAALSSLQRLWQCTEAIGQPEGPDERGKWSEAFDLMMEPLSPVAFAAGGDWATGHLNARGFREGEDYGVVPFPGTESLFIWTADVFPLPLEAPHRAETLDFLATVMTREAQVAFNAKKGGIPAVRTTPAQAREISESAARRVQAFLDAPHRALAMSGLVTPDIPKRLLREALREMLLEADPRTGRDVVLFALQNHYWMLETWTKARVHAER